MASPSQSVAMLASREFKGLDRLLQGRDIVCFSHDWTGDPLSKTHFMRLLSKHNRVLWVNSIGQRMPTINKSDVGRIWRKLKAFCEPVREVEPNIFVLNPLAVPAYGSGLARKLNQVWLRRQVRRAMRKLGFRRAINWTFNPAAALLAGQLGEEELIYQCVDEYSAFSGVATSAMLKMEEHLLRQADLTIVSAENLLRSKSKINPQTVLVRHGVDYEHFRRSLEVQTVVPRALANLPKPVIGYFGLIAQDWVDIPLLVHVAQSFPEASLVLLGKVTMDVSPLAALPNVHILGRQPYEDLPGFCKGFDVALIPFPISEVTLNANPLKAREYLAAGLPVISTAIPEVEVLGQCVIGRTPDEYVAGIRTALERPGPCAARSQTMESESWSARLDEIERHFTIAVGAN
jgi:glycosyltransferase involved in cell wall biosynthesis